MATWVAFTENGRVPCGSLNHMRLDGRWGIPRLRREVSELLVKRAKLYDGAIVYVGRLSDYDDPSPTLFTL